MSDLALLWNADDFAADLGLASGQLVLDDGLRTAVIISLFSDARAASDDVLPEDGADRRGWWGDAVPQGTQPGATVAGDGIGSKLWLLAREKTLPSVLARAESYAKAALQWLIDDGVAKSVTAIAERVMRGGRDTGVLGLQVTIERPAGPARERYDFVWDATGRLIA